MSHAQQERAMNDLKTKGKTKMTTGLLINTIIDHNINQYLEDKVFLLLMQFIKRCFFSH